MLYYYAGNYVLESLQNYPGIILPRTPRNYLNRTLTPPTLITRLLAYRIAWATVGPLHLLTVAISCYISPCLPFMGRAIYIVDLYHTVPTQLSIASEAHAGLPRGLLQYGQGLFAPVWTPGALWKWKWIVKVNREREKWKVNAKSETWTWKVNGRSRLP